MNHLLIAPVVLPALVAPFIIMALRYHVDLQRVFSVASCVLLTVIAVALTHRRLMALCKSTNWATGRRPLALCWCWTACPP